MTKIFATDLHETLVDTELGMLYAVNDALEKMGRSERATSEFIRRVIGRPSVEYFTGLVQNAAQEDVRRFMETLRVTERIHIPPNEKLMPYAGEVLREFKRKGYLLVAVSIMQKRGIESTLRRHGVLYLFDGMIGTEEEQEFGGFDIAAHKGNSLRAYIKETDAVRSVMIGDRDEDMQAALIAGAMPIYFNREGGKHKDAAYSVRNWQELLFGVI